MKPPPVIFTLWTLLALALLLPVTQLLQAAFPIFTVVWILVPVLAVWRSGDARVAGFGRVSWRRLVPTTAINLGGLLVVMALVEPWSHTYQKLLALALSGPAPDSTFAWLLRFPRLPALTGMALFSGLVTLFGEELFFRGWLLQFLQKRLGAAPAVLLQALAFVLPNLLVALALPALQGWLYALVYTWLAVGLIGGWAAWRTGTIWPSLISATVSNLILVALIF
jgi:membrane protease YdiL (CAAX protease family)